MIDDSPLVSIVIPCYNHEKYVQNCIQSVIDQTYNNIELIIIDDGSKDNSFKKIQEMTSKCKKRFVRFEFRHRTNKGLSSTLNESLEWCKGEYYAPIASDDILMPNKTQIQVDYLIKNADTSGVYGGVHFIDDENNIFKTVIFEKENYDFETIFLGKHKLYACTQMMRMDSIRKIGGYKDGCPVEDWYMWLKLSQIGRVSNIKEIFTKYRHHENNTIRQGDVLYEGLISTLSEYCTHPLYFQAHKHIVWVWIASVILRDKVRGRELLLSILVDDPKSVFNKDFLRCLRNFFISDIPFNRSKKG